MRPLTTPKPFNAWGVATLAYVLGTAVLAVTVFVAAWAGFFLVSAMGFVGAARDLTVDDLMLAAVGVAAALMVLSIAIRARIIRKRGGVRPVVAPVAALAASVVLGLAVSAVELPDAVFMVMQAVVEIVVLAKLIDPGR